MKLLIYGRGPYTHAINSEQAWGGAEKQQWIIAKTLVERGHAATIVVNTDTPAEIVPEVDGVRFITVPTGNSLPKLFRVFRQERPDWYYRRTAKASLGPAVLLAKLMGVKSVYACAFDTDAVPRKALASRKWLWPLYKLGLDLSDRILVQHQHQMGLLSAGHQQKAHLVNNIVDLPESLPPKADYVSWVVASLRYPKRPHLLIEVAEALPNVQFVVCGVPAYHRSSFEYGRQIVADFERLPNIDYRGGVAPAEARRIIAASRVFLSTSSGEGFPNTMLEAWSGYTPVLSLEVDPGDVIARHETGVVVQDVAAFQTELKALLEDDDRREQLGENGRQYVERYHSVDHAYEQLRQALNF